MGEIIKRREEIHKGTLILVNRDYPLRQETDIQLRKMSEMFSDITLEREASAMFKKLWEEMCGENEIVLVSGYRTREEQAKIYRTSLRENGGGFTRKYVALPNHSEHQTGLAIDVGEKKEEIDFICPAFADEGVGNTFRRLACQYGFIERYMKEKEQITKIAAEEWHFRYVGYPHSVIIREWGLCLEEYIDLLRNYPYGKEGLVYLEGDRKVEIFYVKAEEKTVISLPECSSYKISGNNVDGFILTMWR